MVEQRRQEAQQAIETSKGQAESVKIRAQADADARLIQAKAEAEALRLLADAIANNPAIINYLYVNKLAPGIQVMLVPNNAPYLLPSRAILTSATNKTAGPSPSAIKKCSWRWRRPPIAIQNALAYRQRLLAEAELQASYERLRALAANLEEVREEERTQIARELHDQLGQALTAMKFDLAWLTDRLVQKDTTLAHKAKAVTAQMDAMIKAVRRIATELRPGMLDDLGLAASIEWLARDFEKRTGIVCAVNVPSPDLPLPRAPSLALFRIFQEALTNVARHAGAQLVEVTLRVTATPEALTLQVHDDGRGIQADAIAGLHSLGLLGMRERAQRVGGTFDIQGVPGDGTIVTASIPLKPNE